ncbi:hypothetical protein VSS37_16650 [Candidatus Thiothrix sp. Deng01]|uniref:Uncharacterized protein n=1 Tax=Candidatus Thiothrix phosphatis TaxID=3112415 RepID=A0ABU6D0L3_9GAMM|nr:hypothetical protein [Candidatus Thiothrix sp. Deng01]MEB4592616.1 hypothetical protein [Candidatus Thiothrix sp. Deng01]
MSAIETMQIGKLITLEQAAHRLAEVDNGYADLHWALLFCLESFTRFCIRVTYPVNTWEREHELQEGANCRQCVAIHEERERLALEDADESEFPEFCDNCEMVAEPIMGQGDYLGQRWGVFFVPAGAVSALANSDIQEVRCSVFYVPDESWSGGYRRFELASDYHVTMDWIDGEESNREEWRKTLDGQSREDSLPIRLADLLVWKEDFESALQGGDARENRKSFPMNNNDTKLNTTEKVTTWMKGYASENGIVSNTPMSDEQLKSFRGDALKAGVAASTFNTCRRALGFLGQDRAG